MEIVLIPGFWLQGDSWGETITTLEGAGHHVQALTLPGLESVDADRSNIGFADHVAAVVAAIDSVDGPVVLVGHSGGGALASGAVDARVDRVARAIYVDSWPLADGGVVNDELPVVDGEVPLPDWSVFDDEDLVGLTEELREHFRSIAIPEPARVTSDKQSVSDPRRYAVPSTIICCEFTGEQMQQWTAGGAPWVAEVAALTDVDFVDLPTGHWPQFTRPTDLATTILAVVERSS